MARPARRSTSDASQAPAHLRPYIDVLGEERAVEFLLEFGGGTFYLAADPKGNSEIARYLGLDLAAQLVAVLRSASSSTYARVPTAKPWIASVLRGRKLSIGAIARKLHVTDVTVARWLPSDNAQIELF